MVFINEVVAAKRNADVASFRDRINTQLEDLKDIATTETTLQRLKAISSNIDKLCSGGKKSSEEAKAKDREYHKRRYREKKDAILGKQKKKRREMRELRESLKPGGLISDAISHSL